MKHLLAILGVLTSAVSFCQSLDQILSNIEPRELGPTTLGGRVSDVAVYEKDPRIFYVATASGGVWKTENGGAKLEPIFDKQPSLATGAVAVNPNDPNDVWVGTGEGSSRNSTCYGDGLYHSTDGGKTWTLVGFEKCRQFSRITFDPNNSKTILVAALGNLWGTNPDRGLFKTTDGGKTWKKVIDGGDKVGVIDVVYNAKNSKIVLAATWERLRVPYNFYSRSANNAIWRSTDGGDHWTKITKGMPKGDLGRIGLDIMRSNPKICVATIDAKDGGGYFRSEDEGQSWVQTSKLDPRPFYFSVPRIDPNDENRCYLPGTELQFSDDKGKTFKTMGDMHPDHHAFWIDPKDSNHMIDGNDGGLVQSRDRGKSWEFLATMRIGQFYAVDYNMMKPYWFGGGAQDNGSWIGPSQTNHGGVLYYDFVGFQFGDGFHVQFDKADSEWFYSESQGGGIMKSSRINGSDQSVRPTNAKTGEPASEKYRFNWSTPFVLSPYNQSTIYMGGNKVFKSIDKGVHWKAISPDLTTNDPSKLKPVEGDIINSGAELHCTIITLNESPNKPGVLWAGTDDGLIQVSQDDGSTWKEVGANISGVPKSTWVSRVAPSRYQAGRCYVSFDGHRTNDYKPYVYMTEDFGATWKNITGNLPDGSVYVVKEGIKNEKLLFAGTEFGLFVSLDQGANWTKYVTGSWPNVRVDDVTIHQRDMDLLIATHGRSFWSIPISPLEQLTDDARTKDVFLCEPATAYLLGRQDGAGYTSFGEFSARNTQPSTVIAYWLKNKTDDKVVVSVLDAKGNEVTKFDGKGAAGLNTVAYNIRGRNSTRRTSDFTVVLKIGDKEVARTSLRVENLIQDN